VEYVELGTTGERVSRLGFGGAPVGLHDYLGAYDPADSTDREQVRAALETALECGITYFDTAPGYGEGASEEIYGEVLEGEDVFLATKVELRDAAYVRDRVEGSRDRLRRDTIDLLQIHGGSYSDTDVETILEEGVAEELQALKDEGLVNYVGFTTEDNNPATYELIRSEAFDTMQINYNLLFQHPYSPINESGSLLEARDHDLGTITMRTTTSGIFQEWVDTVNPDNEFEYAPALIQFVLSNPHVDVALVGMRDPDIVEENAALVEDREGRVDIQEIFDRYP
jgi:aryl-alcohol dehydrogenase-like predicted oxidoreductase